jgi:hypothetical protein
LEATDGDEATSLKTGIRPSAKNDPRLVAAARELKDRWLEEINSGRYLPMGNGKYEISRQIEARVENVEPEDMRHSSSAPKRLAA